MAKSDPDSQRASGLSLPSDARFYQSVLDHLPAPVLVVDPNGSVVYANSALAALAGWTVEQGIGFNIFEHIHPDDSGWVAQAFVELAAGDSAGVITEHTPWAAIGFRMIDRAGRTIPVEVTGSAGIMDPAVGGIMYNVRPAWERVLLGEVLAGLASGEPIGALLESVVQMIGVPPLEVDAAVLDCSVRDSHEVVAGSADLAALLHGLGDPLPWTHPGEQPVVVELTDVAAPLGPRLIEAGYRDLFHCRLASPDPEVAFRLVACTPVHHVPANGTRQRLERAQDLAAVVLARAHADRLLLHAAQHDGLTELPNRSALYQRLEELIADATPLALLYIDLDGFKPVNDQYGHAVGDAVLREVGARLQHLTRPADMAARIGGDEFAVVRVGEADEEVLAALARRILGAITEPIELGEHTIQVGASVGTVISGAMSDAGAIVAAADAAMYAAKAAGGRQHCAAPHEG